MPNRFCAICGKGIGKNAPHFGMCLKCYLKEHTLFELPQKFSLKVCIDCGKYSKKEAWFESDEEDIFSIIEVALQELMLKPIKKKTNLIFSMNFKEESFIYSSKDLLTSMDITINGALEENENIRHEETIRLNISYELCKNCSNLRGGTYFLSIIQLRVKEDNQFNLIKDILDKLQTYVEKQFEKDQRQYISKIENQKNGVDLYLSTNELMNRIVSQLKAENYHFAVKRSKKLVGRDSQRGKNLYRLKTLIKFLPLSRMDLVFIENHKYSVDNITKNRVVLRGENGTKLIKDYSYFFNENISIKERQKDD